MGQQAAPSQLGRISTSTVPVDLPGTRFISDDDEHHHPQLCNRTEHSKFHCDLLLRLQQTCFVTTHDNQNQVTAIMPSAVDPDDDLWVAIKQVDNPV